jgi:hypothetical protein
VDPEKAWENAFPRLPKQGTMFLLCSMKKMERSPIDGINTLIRNEISC